MIELSVPVLSCRRLPPLLRTVEAARAHFARVETNVKTTWICFDNGSPPEDHAALANLDFDLLAPSSKNLGQAPALDRLLNSVRSEYFLLIEDDWLLDNPKGACFVEETVAILRGDPNLGAVKIDDCHFTDFGDRQRHDGPFHAPGRSLPYFVQNPALIWGGFCFPPSAASTEAIRRVGPISEDPPLRNWWPESEYSARFAGRYYVVKSTEMLILRHVGGESCDGWATEEAGVPGQATFCEGLAATEVNRTS